MKRITSFTLLVVTILMIQINPVSANQVDFHNMIVKEVFLPSEFSKDFEHICISEVDVIQNEKSSIESIIFIEDYYFCNYARKWKNKIGEIVNLNEPTQLYHQNDDLILTIQNYFPKSKILFIDPI